jgi:ArsR family transcriptional regulator, arsenate/arsenite/antimonite-responsive transcriptional repressor
LTVGQGKATVHFVRWRNGKTGMREFMNITKALADENRVRMLLALRVGELCVCQITELFGLAPSTVSKHLSILYQAGLAESRKEGRWIYYRLPGKEAPTAVRRALDWVAGSVNGARQVAEDTDRLKKILTIDRVELCKKQCRK